MAICRTVFGYCQVDCVDVPQHLLRVWQSPEPPSSPLLEWIVNSIGENQDIRRLHQARFVKALHRGIYLDANFRIIARFKLPKTHKLKY